MIHRTYREVRAWFREIEAEDIAQQILTLFLELVDSPSPITISNHLPIALTRALRKNAFRWADQRDRDYEAAELVHCVESFLEMRFA